MDVGFHVGTTKPNTVWGVTWAIISFHMGNDEFVKALQLVYKL